MTLYSQKSKYLIVLRWVMLIIFEYEFLVLRIMETFGGDCAIKSSNVLLKCLWFFYTSSCSSHLQVIM